MNSRYFLIHNVICPISSFILQSDWEMIWEPHSYLDLTRAYTQLIGESISANTMVKGTLFQDKVMGYMISKSLWLGQEIKPLYGKTLNGQLQFNLEGMNRTRGFDLSIGKKWWTCNP